MSQRHLDARSRGNMPVFSAPSDHARVRLKKRALFWPAFLPLIIVSGILVNWVFLAQITFAAPATPYSTPGQNTVQQFLKEGQPSKANQAPFQRPVSAPGALKPAAANTQASTTVKPLPSAEPAKMQDMTYTLDDSFVLHRPTMKQSSLAPKVQGTAIPAGTTPFAIKGSDGRLEVDVPRGSLDFAHATLADGSALIGQLVLQIHQISGHYIESESILGTYQIQIVDSQGNVVQGVTVLHPITISYHYQTWEMQDLGIDPAQVHLAWPRLLAAAHTAKQPASAQTASGLVVPMTNDPKTHTLSAQSTMLGGVMTFQV